MQLPDSARELIESGALAHLVTLNADGSPQVTCVWVGLDGDELVSGHLASDQRKLGNVRRDPRVSLSLEGTRIHPPGLKEYLVLHGRARLEEGGAPELLQRLAHTYLGAEVKFPPMDDPPPGHVMRIIRRPHRRHRPLGERLNYAPIPIEEIEAARERIAGSVVRTPLVRLQHEAPGEIYLKLENLQPIGSFKLRGAGNALHLADRDELTAGIWTASAGNMAQAAAWHARARGLPCTVVVPETAPKAKLDAIERLGGEIVPVPFETWWEVFRTRSHPGLDGFFLHAFSDPAVMAGNGTIGLEIADDLPDVDAVLVPYGGGGLICGVASALRVAVPRCAVYACEVETAARSRPRWPRECRWRSSTRAASSTGSVRRPCSPRCSPWRGSWSRGPSSPASTRSPPR